MKNSLTFGTIGMIILIVFSFIKNRNEMSNLDKELAALRAEKVILETAIKTLKKIHNGQM